MVRSYRTLREIPEKAAGWGLLLALVLGILQIAAPANADELQNGAQRYWISFTDRGSLQSLTGEEIRTKAFAEGLTEEAVKRRRLEDLEGDSLITLADLSPDPEYLQALQTAGADIRRVSRWFNSASVFADENTLQRIRALPFVKTVRPVLKGQLASFSYEEAGSWDGYPPPGPGADQPGMYGPSYLQALQVNAVEAHRQGYIGRGVLMVVLDSGFELSHEAFARLDVFAAYDFIQNDPNPGVEPDDPPGQAAHGSACLSVIAGYSPGNLIGIAHGASFLLAKTEDTSREVVREEDDFVTALEWAERLGTRALSASLSYKDWYQLRDYDGATPLTSKGINRARKLGVLCATAMSNEGPQPMTLGAPADAPGNLSSGAVDSTGKIARFSSRGPTADGRIKPDLCTMGVKTACISPFSEHRYSRWSGTSLSTPVLAGVIALVRSAHLDWSAEKTARALKSTASRADRPDNVYGWGIPDVMAAIRYPEIRLQFLDETSQPVEGVQVALSLAPETPAVNQPETKLITGTSSSAGVVSFPNLEDGVWSYEVTLPRGWKIRTGTAPGAITCPDGGVRNISLSHPN